MRLVNSHLVVDLRCLVHPYPSPSPASVPAFALLSPLLPYLLILYVFSGFLQCCHCRVNLM